MKVYLHNGYRHGEILEMQDQPTNHPIEIPVPANMVAVGLTDDSPIPDAPNIGTDTYWYQFTMGELHVYSTVDTTPQIVLEQLSDDYNKLSKHLAMWHLEQDNRRLRHKVEELTAQVAQLRTMTTD